jgi:NADH dehydrogenase FAD-containing subunit
VAFPPDHNPIDHLIEQLERAAESPTRSVESAAQCTFVVVGAGCTGTETAAHGERLTAVRSGSRRS